MMNLKMLMAPLLLAVTATIGPPLMAQRGKATRSASTVEGDVYVVTQSGDTKRGAGRTVLLLKDAGVRDTIRAVCGRALQHQIDLTKWRAALLDTERLVRSGAYTTEDIYQILNREQRIDKGIASWKVDARKAVLDAVAAAIVDSTGTGMNAHYRFEVARPGSYFLFSDWDMGDNHYVWWAPVTIGRTAAKRDLDNSVIVDRGAFCL
jgi:hypothetical protein